MKTFSHLTIAVAMGALLSYFTSYLILRETFRQPSRYFEMEESTPRMTLSLLPSEAWAHAAVILYIPLIAFDDLILHHLFSIGDEYEMMMPIHRTLISP